MKQQEIIRGRLNYNRKWLESVLARLTPDLLPWAPEKSMRTVSGQLIEILSVEASLLPVLKGGTELSDDEVAALVGDPTSLESLKEALSNVRRGTLEYLDKLSESDLEEPVSLPQWYGAYWPKPCPLGEHFRNIAEHEFYHVGQLISYLWCKGDNPYDW